MLLVQNLRLSDVSKQIMIKFLYSVSISPDESNVPLVLHIACIVDADQATFLVIH